MSTAPTAQEQFDERASGTLAAIYLTPDVAAQRDKVMALLAPRAGERALDIGCGPGLTTEALARAVGSAGRLAGRSAGRSASRLADQPAEPNQTRFGRVGWSGRVGLGRSAGSGRSGRFGRSG